MAAAVYYRQSFRQNYSCVGHREHGEEYSPSKPIIRTDSFVSYGCEDAAFFDLEMDDGSSWSPTEHAEVPQVDKLQLDQDVELLQAICKPSSIAEERLVRKVSKIIKLEQQQKQQQDEEVPIRLDSNGLDLEEMNSLFNGLPGHRSKLCFSRQSTQDCLRSPKHDFLRVLVGAPSVSTDMIIDKNFRNLFAVARPTEYYSKLFECIPKVFVGTEDRLRCLVTFMADQLSKTFKDCGMPCPPWREKTSLLNMWAL